MLPEDRPKLPSALWAVNDKREREISYGPAPPLPSLQEWINAYKEQGILTVTESLVLKEIEPVPVVPPNEATPEDAATATYDKLRAASNTVKSVTNKWQKAVATFDSAALDAADVEAQLASAKGISVAARERMDAKPALKLEKEL